MAINKITVEGFTAFNKVDISFSDGINVFIGDNGTGKTHLLKLLYAISQHEYKGVDPASVSMEMQPVHFYITSWIPHLAPYFQAEEGKEFHRHLHFQVPFSIGAVVNGNGFCYKSSDSFEACDKPNKVSVFIPAKEMLTHAGLEKDFASRLMPFDVTLIDILNIAGMSVITEHDECRSQLLQSISNIIGGTIAYEKDCYYIYKDSADPIRFSFEAEGHKKLGLLYRLIQVGVLKKGSILIWDEPESNLNPKLIPDLVDAVLALEQAGVQMFFATHDYFFAKFLEVRKTKANKVRYHALYKEHNDIHCETQSDFELLENNSIIAQSIALYKEEIKKVLG